MDDYGQQIKEGKRIVVEYAKTLVPKGVQLSWGDRSGGDYSLIAEQSGRTIVVCKIGENNLADVPGSYADASGEDDLWPRVRGFVKDAVAESLADRDDRKP